MPDALPGRQARASRPARSQAPATLERRPGLTWVVYVVAGEATIAGRTATAGDGIIIEHVPGDISPIALAGDLVLVRLEHA